MERLGKPPGPAEVVRGAAGSIAFAKPYFFEDPKQRTLGSFCSVLGPQNRPKTVPKRGPGRVRRPASFCNRFSMDFRSSETRKSFKNLRKIDVFAKLGFAVPTPKNVDFGRHFGTRNASKIVQNGCPKTDGKSIAFWIPFLSILERFWRPRPPPKSSKNRPKSHF